MPLGGCGFPGVWSHADLLGGVDGMRQLRWGGWGRVVIEMYHCKCIHFHWKACRCYQAQTDNHNTFPRQCGHRRKSTIQQYSLHLNITDLTYLFHFEECSSSEVAVTASLMLSANSFQLKSLKGQPTHIVNDSFTDLQGISHLL